MKQVSWLGNGDRHQYGGIGHTLIHQSRHKLKLLVPMLNLT
jgi:hypothetical protein